jgi:hypothetical protein
MSSDLRFWSPRRDSNPRPSDYESKSIRPAGTNQTRSGCSRQPGRPLSAFLTRRGTAGGMTKRMTELPTAEPLDRRRPIRSATSSGPLTGQGGRTHLGVGAGSDHQRVGHRNVPGVCLRRSQSIQVTRGSSAGRCGCSSAPGHTQLWWRGSRAARAEWTGQLPRAETGRRHRRLRRRWGIDAKQVADGGRSDQGPMTAASAATSQDSLTHMTLAASISPDGVAQCASSLARRSGGAGPGRLR